MNDELKNKYKLFFVKKARYYYTDLKDKIFAMESTTPRCLILLSCGKRLFYKSWAHVTIELFNYLQIIKPKSVNDLLELKASWSDKIKLFAFEKLNDNFNETHHKLWMNCNLTSTHFVWFIRELLIFYNIPLETSYLIYHKTPKAEADTIKDAITVDFKQNLLCFLEKKYNFSKEKSKKVLHNMELINDVFKNNSRGYNNIFLFDSYTTFLANQGSLLKIFSNSEYGNSAKNIFIAKKLFSYLLNFYRLSGYSTSIKEDEEKFFSNFSL